MPHLLHMRVIFIFLQFIFYYNYISEHQWELAESGEFHKVETTIRAFIEHAHFPSTFKHDINLLLHREQLDGNTGH